MCPICEFDELVGRFRKKGGGFEEGNWRGGREVVEMYTFDITSRYKHSNNNFARSRSWDGHIVDCGMELGEGVDHDFFHYFGKRTNKWMALVTVDYGQQAKV